MGDHGKSTESTDFFLKYRISSFRMPRRLFNFGTFRCGVYQRTPFISKIKIQGNEINQNNQIFLKPFGVKL